MGLIYKMGLALLFLGSFVAGQSQGSYTLFGAGCQGSGKGPGYGVTLNSGGGSLVQQTLYNEYAFAVIAPRPMMVTGFELFTATSTAKSYSMQACLYRQDPISARREPSRSPAATGAMLVGKTPAFYRVTFKLPVAVKKGEYFWISQMDSTNVRASDLQQGASPPGTTYWRSPGVGAWMGTTILKHPAWLVTCAGGATPLLSVTVPPRLGKTFSVDLRNAFGPTISLLLLGNSRTAYGSLTLPFDLTNLGANGCSLFTSATIIYPVGVGNDGRGSFGFSVPNLPALRGARFFNQYLIHDPGANSLGVVTTNCGEAVVGG